ncbi:MAG TPA: stress-induced protein [Pseudomonas sp.]|nr:stress-induced protein [Pseudomonas sp.]
MANDPGKTGQQGGTQQTDQGNFANDRDKAAQGGQSDRESQGGTQQGGQGGHGSGHKSDTEQSDKDDASQAVQDEDSTMTDDNR